MSVKKQHLSSLNNTALCRENTVFIRCFRQKS